MDPKKLLPVLIGAAVGIAALVPLGAFAFIKSGIYDVGASRPHTRVTEWITHETMARSVKRRAAAIEWPKRVTRAQVLAGFCTYETHCVACHGAAGIARAHWISGLEPQPPYLVDATDKWSPSELFWIAKNGIKMTGMPAWRDSLSDAEIWNVVGFMEAARRLPPQTHAEWRAKRMCGAFSGPWPAPERPATHRP